MDLAEAQAFTEQWVRDWNAHDVDALLAHFTHDVVFTSPAAVRLLGGDGVIRGKEALRKYWSEGVRLIPDLHSSVRCGVCDRRGEVRGAAPHRPVPGRKVY
jgi:ketosteroid isomerase-like protein